MNADDRRDHAMGIILKAAGYEKTPELTKKVNAIWNGMTTRRRSSLARELRYVSAMYWMLAARVIRRESL